MRIDYGAARRLDDMKIQIISRHLLRSFAAIAIFIGIAVCGVVVVFMGRVGERIYEIYDRRVQFDAKPNPVVVKDGVYWFPLGGRLFAVPENYVVGYGRNSTDGSVHAFSLHALLPDFEGRTPENKAKFSARGWGDRIEIAVTVGGMSVSEREQKDHEIYLVHKKEYGSEVVSEMPHIEKISEKLSDQFYLIENARVKKEIKCSKGAPANSCRNIALNYRDNIEVWIIYSRKYERDWIKIHDRAVTFLETFERPLDALPNQP